MLARIVRPSPLLFGCRSVSTQLEAMQRELCIVVNERDEQVGVASKEACHKLLGPDQCASTLPLHRAFSLLIFHDHRLLLQQRSVKKLTFPGRWTNSLCSHPLVSDASMQLAIQRKARDELNLEIAVEDLQACFKLRYWAKGDDCWGEHELDHVYALQMPSSMEITPNPEEVMNTRLVDKAELAHWMATEPTVFTPWFHLIMQRFTNWPSNFT